MVRVRLRVIRYKKVIGVHDCCQGRGGADNICPFAPISEIISKGWNGRGPCQYRNLCDRGCPFGGYFSSNSATLPLAASTGNLTLRPHSIVMEVMYDKEKKKAKGVRIIDENTNETVWAGMII